MENVCANQPPHSKGYRRTRTLVHSKEGLAPESWPEQQHIEFELQNKMGEACFRSSYEVAREEEKAAAWQSGKGHLRRKYLTLDFKLSLLL